MLAQYIENSYAVLQSLTASCSTGREDQMLSITGIQQRSTRSLPLLQPSCPGPRGGGSSCSELGSATWNSAWSAPGRSAAGTACKSLSKCNELLQSVLCKSNIQVVRGKDASGPEYTVLQPLDFTSLKEKYYQFAGFHISSFESLNINFQKSNKLFHLGNDLENSIVLQRAAVPNLEMKFIK